MLNHPLHNDLLQKYRRQYGRDPAVTAYAPGRVEVLGNHTDYNEGFVLSAAISFGTFFACAPRTDAACRLTAGDLMQEVSFPAGSPEASREHGWSNYVKGVLAGLGARSPLPHGFDGMFLGNVPLGSGLSSSAALEMCSGLALAKLYGIPVDPISLARIGQAAEHHYAGVKCGLLDQISSLFGKTGTLVETDFRSLAVNNVPLGRDACLLMCNTHARHALVDGEYNQRRAACEAAAAYFATVLPHPVRALRDVSTQEWEAHRAGLPEVVARRAAHPIGENERVRKGARLLARNDLAGFGRLMYESHESSRTLFENSCPELDFIVQAAQGLPGVLGARLSGGGFGGSAVALVQPREAAGIGAALTAAYQRAFGSPCDTCVMVPSDGARLVPA
jgi:galactokinase